MIEPASPSTRAAGLWAAVLSTLLSIAYVLAQLAEWMGWMGSGGGAHPERKVAV